ncbi:hypothetical protein GCM10009839_33890 [Catenulispora yoronensis]|uniref:Amino acid permease/ SLC12A domain-containing protein n=1 Tax=Catenulispora yoronensis TaxID=450799 RepID=A0ABP5FSJ8_9ACTN
MPRRSPAPSKVSAALARDRLGVTGVMFFILAGVAPLTVTAGVVPTAYAVTGLTSVPAAFLVVAVVLGVFAVGYVAMAQRIPNAGAFYAFISHGLSKPAGVGGALVAVVAYNVLQVGLYGMIGPSLQSFAADNFGVNAPWGVWAFGAWAVVTILGLMRVDLSGHLLGVLSTIELVVIVALTVRGLAHPAVGGISAAALSPTSLHFTGLGAVLAVAVLGFTGFEQAPVFSEEARDARRTIPLATFVSLAVIAVVYAGASWALDVHYGNQVVATAQGPGSATMLFAMAPGLLASAARTLFLTSLLAAALAFHNAVGRYMWALGRERVLPAAMGITRPEGCLGSAESARCRGDRVGVGAALGSGRAVVLLGRDHRRLRDPAAAGRYVGGGGEVLRHDSERGEHLAALGRSGGIDRAAGRHGLAVRRPLRRAAQRPARLVAHQGAAWDLRRRCRDRDHLGAGPQAPPARCL